MDMQMVVDVTRDTLYVSFLVSMPMMVAALVIGVAISLVQAVTQVQEMTLTFIPKILVVAAVMLLTLPFVITTMVEYTLRIFTQIGNL